MDGWSSSPSVPLSARCLEQGWEPCPPLSKCVSAVGWACQMCAQFAIKCGVFSLITSSSSPWSKHQPAFSPCLFTSLQLIMLSQTNYAFTNWLCFYKYMHNHLLSLIESLLRRLHYPGQCNNFYWVCCAELGLLRQSSSAVLPSATPASRWNQEIPAHKQ